MADHKIGSVPVDKNRTPNLMVKGRGILCGVHAIAKDFHSRIMSVEASGGEPSLLCDSDIGDDMRVILKGHTTNEKNQLHSEVKKLASNEESDDCEGDIPFQNSNIGPSSSNFDDSIKKMPTTLPAKRHLDNSKSSHTSVKMSKLSSYDDDDDIPFSSVVKMTAISAGKSLSTLKTIIDKKLALIEKSFEECQRKRQVKEQRLHSLEELVRKRKLELKTKEAEIHQVLHDINKQQEGKEEELGVLLHKISECTEKLKTKEEELNATKQLIAEQKNELESEKEELHKVISTRTVQCAQMKDFESMKKQHESRIKELESIEKCVDGRLKELNLKEEDVESKRKQLEHQLEEHNSKEKQLKDQEKELHKHFDSLEKELKSKKKQLEGDVQEFESKEKKFQGQVKAQVKDVESKKKHFESLMEELKSKEKQLEGRAEELDLKEKQLKGQVKEFETKEEEFVKQVKDVESKKEHLKSLMEELKSKETKLDGQVEELGLKGEQLKGQVKEFESKEEEFVEQVKALESKKKHFESIMEELKSKEKQLEGRVKQFELKEEQLKGHVKEFELKKEEFEKSKEKIEKQYEVFVKSFEEENELDEPESLNKKILVNLEATSDPSKVVLDIIQKPIVPCFKNIDDAVIIDSSHIFLLEQLLRISPSIKSHVREEAKKLALDLKANMKTSSKNSLEVLGFLLLLSIYGLVPFFDEEEVLKLFEFADKNSGFVQNLVNKQQYIEAVRFLCAFKLADKNQPVDLLREYVLNAKLVYESSCKNTNSLDIKDKARNQEIASLKSVLQCILDNNLESDSLVNEIEGRIIELNRQKGSSVCIGTWAILQICNNIRKRVVK